MRTALILLAAGIQLLVVSVIASGNVAMSIPAWSLLSQAPNATGPGLATVYSILGVSRSQHSEDIHLFTKYFCGVKNGTFLELGGLDGLLFSNTYALEHKMGWKGVLIEPNPKGYLAITHNRPHVFAVNAAVCKEPTRVHFVNSGAVGGVLEFMGDSFVKQWHPILADLLPAERAAHSHVSAIMCVPLPSLLEHTSIKHFNFWSLDVEGGELQVLNAVDFNKLTFDVIVVEADGHNAEKDEAVRDLLESNGYEFDEHIASNDWFVRKSWTRMPC
ncbi:hypothetical protein FOA52_004863 [Chlamydomonas sp. UWO 241]|nr:hypothetical protein FOA52_004863 [Chlamydomonas sp. UWO 241]